MTHPRLSICVPSRNRPKTFQETIRSLVSNLRFDVEFVFTDNSDDPAPMNDFMREVARDPRVVWQPSTGATLSMMRNWERCVSGATGDWVIVIGDDDYADPDVIDVIDRIEATGTPVDAITWGRLAYNWPDNRARPCNVMVKLGTGIHKVERETLIGAMFRWEGAGETPNSPFGIYHGALSRHALDTLKARFGCVFEFPVVDYESIIKMLFVARGFAYVERPYSVLGACAASNSGGNGDAAELQKRYEAFMADLGRNLDHDPDLKDFPFTSNLGVAAAVAQVQHWYKTRNGYRVTGWEKRFAEACARSCSNALTEIAYRQMCDGYGLAFDRWEGGRHRKHFRPEWQPVRATGYRVFTGREGDRLYLDEAIGGVETPRALYDLIDQIVVPGKELDLRFAAPARAASGGPPPLTASGSGKSRRR
ncbi:glycosyltransferase family 2 protein [Ensifer soli]|uniref:glycosyltransferase family 2 protein n=1 Tax=Ciceribacter sp. sgz301302 TaxID=3342379 RepID=UPI0035B7BFBA